MGGPGAKGGGGPKTDLSQVGEGALQVHTGTQGLYTRVARGAQVHCGAQTLSVHLFTSSNGGP